MKIEMIYPTFIDAEYCEAGTIIELNDRKAQDLIDAGRSKKVSIFEPDQKLLDRSIGLSDNPEFSKRRGRTPKGE